MEGVLGQALELRKPDLCYAPEAFDSVDVDAASCELVLRMVDAEMAIAQVHQAVVSPPAV